MKKKLFMAVGTIPDGHTFIKIRSSHMKKLYSNKLVIQVNVTMAVISALKQMETVYLLTNGGPGNSTQFAANYLYQQAFKAYRYGYGNDIGVVFIIICLLATVFLNKIFEDRDTKPLKKTKGQLNGTGWKETVKINKTNFMDTVDYCGSFADISIDLVV